MNNWSRDVCRETAFQPVVMGYDGSWSVIVLCAGRSVVGTGAEKLNTSVILDEDSFGVLCACESFRLTGVLNQASNELSNVGYQILVP